MLRSILLLLAEVFCEHCKLVGDSTVLVKMCEDCVKEEYPDRENMCHDTGAYMMNFRGCVKCQKTDALKEVERVESEVNDEELIEYKHICGSCGHIIASHESRFKVDGDFQVYEMYCLLCGTGEDERSIMPLDPRQQPIFFC